MALFERAAHGFSLADAAHLALAPDRALGHGRSDAEFTQGDAGFFHLGGATLAVAGHALDVVVCDFAEIERRVIVLHRPRDLVDEAGALGGKEAFERERLQALD